MRRLRVDLGHAVDLAILHLALGARRNGTEHAVNAVRRPQDSRGGFGQVGEVRRGVHMTGQTCPQVKDTKGRDRRARPRVQSFFTGRLSGPPRERTATVNPADIRAPPEKHAFPPDVMRACGSPFVPHLTLPKSLCLLFLLPNHSLSPSSSL